MNAVPYPLATVWRNGWLGAEHACRRQQALASTAPHCGGVCMYMCRYLAPTTLMTRSTAAFPRLYPANYTPFPYLFAGTWALTTAAPREPIIHSFKIVLLLLTAFFFIARRYLGPDYSDAEKRGVLGAVSAADIPSLARASFPLCMYNMYSSLHSTGDLKHEGRQQLGLFLKVCGQGWSLAWLVTARLECACFRHVAFGFGFRCTGRHIREPQAGLGGFACCCHW